MANQSMSQIRTIRTVSLLWVASILGAGCTFLTQVILARQLGPSGFGSFAAALAMTTLFAPLAGFGLSQYWMKAYGLEGWKASRWLSSSFKFAGASALSVLVVLIVWSSFGPHDEQTSSILLILAIHVVGLLAVDLTSCKYQLEENYFGLALFQFLPHLGRLIIIVAFTSFGVAMLSAQTAAYSYAIVAVGCLAVSVWQLRRMYQKDFSLVGHGKPQDRKPCADSETPGVIAVARNTWQFGLTGFCYLIYFQIDIVLLRYITGGDSAGVYSVAFAVMSAVYLFPMVIYQKFLLPKMHRWASQDKNKLFSVYREGNSLMLKIGIVATLMLWTLAPSMVPLIFGPEYEESVGILMLLSIAAPLRFAAASAGAVLATEWHVKNKLYIMGFAAIFNLVLSVALIPFWSTTGAAIATIITELLLVLLMRRYARIYVFPDFNLKAAQ
jgi:O-antigen/teichoic acid export membrane protein